MVTKYSPLGTTGKQSQSKPISPDPDEAVPEKSLLGGIVLGQTIWYVRELHFAIASGHQVQERHEYAGK
jgi:hypothetical protein